MLLKKRFPVFILNPDSQLLQRKALTATTYHAHLIIPSS